MKGVVKTGDSLLLGPDSTGQFEAVSVKGVHVTRTPTNRAVAGQSASLALKKVKRQSIRKGMVLIHPSLQPRACIGFDARISVLQRNTCIRRNYQAVVHVGTFRQTAQIVSSTPDELRTGEKGVVRFNFLHRPEYVKVGARLIFRDGRTKGMGRVVKLYYYDEHQGYQYKQKKKN